MGNELDLDALCRKDHDERVSLHPGAVIAGSYLIDRVLGVGGMGTVVSARSLATGELVAIKFMLPHCEDQGQLLVRFQREARATERLKSKHVGRVLSTGEVSASMPFIVMEYLDGEDLKSLVKREGPLEPRQAAAYISQACDALAEAHALGIVHRDLKPANLFLARQPRGPSIIKVLDFGVAKFESPNVSGDNQEVTASHAVVGTHHCMAPEQIVAPQGVSALADVWALGAILHFLLTGKTPFAAPTLAEVIVNVLREDPHAIEALRPCVPPRLNAIVKRCLEKDREKRFPNATELARELAPLASLHHGGEVLGNGEARDVLTRTVPLLLVEDRGAERPRTAITGGKGRGVAGRAKEKISLRTRAFLLGGALGSMVVGGLLAVVAMPAQAGRAAEVEASEVVREEIVAVAEGKEVVAQGASGSGAMRSEVGGGGVSADAAAQDAEAEAQEQKERAPELPRAIVGTWVGESARTPGRTGERTGRKETAGRGNVPLFEMPKAASSIKPAVRIFELANEARKASLEEAP